ncbi:glutamate synthase subunit beta [Jiulongibacter sediminis]|uniref:Glutamate synthase n=1 Tax=Jiulongibacter sediminis TaxID=1605367 RepID=A0A0P7BRD7_9BACT|nr:glutamate synthase subunit beta [Jiulongibacter sediminis]KPM49842.1 glutamate synthase [Jiulongibacter sediminis]TBX26878.1 glutamate synthase [Jiulongibacter sediminis]
MGKPTGFLEIERKASQKRAIEDRKKDYQEVDVAYSSEQTKDQAARCMDCGIPFCHSGCPLGNIIPEFNDAVYDENWKLAYELLSSTNNFPEFTGRICPAPCEAACVLGINKPPVAIEYIEKSIIERAFEEGWVVPQPPKNRTGKKVAVVGSGPAGMAAADQLNKAGHTVTLYERADQIGGLVRYGIPDFKLNKDIIDRRAEVMKAEGIIIKTGVNVGVDVKASQLERDFDAVVLTGGSTVPRDLNIPGRELKGVHFAMEFLSQQNKRVADSKGKNVDQSVDHQGFAYENGEIWATDKNVVVIGGGDTGSDCVGTSNRHKAKSISQIEIMPMPPKERAESTPWPLWPMQLRTSTSHEEGCERGWSINTKEFVGDGNGNLKALKTVEIEWVKDNGRMVMKDIQGTEKEIPCELALLAAGFLHPQHDGLLNDLGIEYDQRGNINAPKYQTSNEKIFAAGDMRRGQSLVVWAISEGREAARAVDEYLMGESFLEAKAVSMISPSYLGV